MKTYTPPKNTTLLWQIRIGVMSTTLVVAIYAAAKLFGQVYPVIAVAEGILILMGIILIFAYIPSYFKRYSIITTKNAIIIRSGIFLKTERIMPEPRMLYAESYHTPLAKALGLSGLLLRASRAATFCAELEEKDIKEILKEMAG